MWRRRLVTFTLVAASLFVATAPVTSVYLIAQRAHDQNVAVARAGRESDIKTCEQINRLRDGIVGYVEALGRARRTAALATVTSPYATPDQKQTAIANLHNLAEVDRQTRKQFADEDCTKIKKVD